MAIEIPKEVGQAEAALRRKHVAELTEHASGQPAEIYRYLTSRGRKITRSMPVRDYVEKRRKLKHAMNEFGSPLGWEMASRFRRLAHTWLRLRSSTKTTNTRPALWPRLSDVC